MKNDHDLIDSNPGRNQGPDAGSASHEEVRKGRIFNITDKTFKILCQADRKNYDPTIGLENLVAMYVSLAGPIDFKKLDIERAKSMAKKLKLLSGP